MSDAQVSYFFRAVIEKFEEIGEEPNCTVEDVTDEIFDMVKPADPHAITLKDLLECKVSASPHCSRGEACAAGLVSARPVVCGGRWARQSWACSPMSTPSGSMTEESSSWATATRRREVDGRTSLTHVARRLGGCCIWRTLHEVRCEAAARVEGQLCVHCTNEGRVLACAVVLLGKESNIAWLRDGSSQTTQP